MSDKEIIEISIPADNDGFVLLQCSYCGEFFRLEELVKLQQDSHSMRKHV